MAKYDFECREKTSLKLKFIYKDKAGTPVAFGGYTARMVIKKVFGGTATATLDISTSDFITLGATDGNITISVPAASNTMLAGSYVYILYLIAPGTGSEEFLSGQITCTEGMI